jgi:hypothetical protein
MERLGATQIPPWALRVHSKKQLTAEPLRGTIDPLRPLEQLRQCGSHGMEPIDRAAADGPARAAGIAASTLERCPAKACPGLDPGACPGLDPGWKPVSRLREALAKTVVVWTNASAGVGRSEKIMLKRKPRA